MWSRDQEHERVAELFEGRGNVRVWNLCPDAPIKPFTAVLGCELEPSASVGPHVQQHYDEIVIVLEGHGMASVDAQRVALEPGSVVGLALGQILSLENTSSVAPLRYLIIKAG